MKCDSDQDAVQVIQHILARGHSQAWIARQVRVSTYTVHRWATGQSVPRESLARRLRVLEKRTEDQQVNPLFDLLLTGLLELRHHYYGGDPLAVSQTLDRLGPVAHQLTDLLTQYANSEGTPDHDRHTDRRRPRHRGSLVAALVLASLAGAQVIGTLS